MESIGKDTLLDADGGPLDPRIQTVLRQLVPRFRNRFLTLRDEVLVAEIFEEAGSRLAESEASGGRPDNLEAYAWTVLVNVARTRLNRSSLRLERATLSSDVSGTVLGSLRSRDGTPEQIEAAIQLQEWLAAFTAQERQLCMLKLFGCSSREIARQLNTSPAYVDKLFYRIRQKCRELGGQSKTTADTSSKPTP